MHYQKPSLFHYRLAQALCGLVSGAVFWTKRPRNEIRDKEGPYVVIANHQCMLDFVGLIGATRRPMSFVISNSFFQSLPITGFLQKMGVIPKQQFQTSVRDMKRMKAVVDHGQPLVIYPAGLMCEDGLSTPIPAATYKFLKWLGVDVYAARVSGTYFVMPKWGKGLRPGKTSLDIYRLFTKEELEKTDLETIRQKTEQALLFDAYREQETNPIRYWHNDCIDGLQNVLYLCPHCKAEFSMEVADGSVLRCRSCGYTQTSDRFGLMHNTGDKGPELRYVSDWSSLIQQDLRRRILLGKEQSLSSTVAVRMIDPEKHAFVDAGTGTLTLDREKIQLKATLRGEPVSLSVPVYEIPVLPFSPGKHLELQSGGTIYRCLPEDGRLVMKLIHMLKIFHELSRTSAEPAVS